MLSDLFLQRLQYLLSTGNVRLCLSRILFAWCLHVISPYGRNCGLYPPFYSLLRPSHWRHPGHLHRMSRVL